MIISKGYWNNNGEEQGKYAEMMTGTAAIILTETAHIMTVAVIPVCGITAVEGMATLGMI